MVKETPRRSLGSKLHSNSTRRARYSICQMAVRRLSARNLSVSDAFFSHPRCRLACQPQTPAKTVSQFPGSCSFVFFRVVFAWVAAGRTRQKAIFSFFLTTFRPIVTVGHYLQRTSTARSDRKNSADSNILS